MPAIRFPPSWKLPLGGGGSLTVATRFACSRVEERSIWSGSEKTTCASVRVDLWGKEPSLTEGQR